MNKPRIQAAAFRQLVTSRPLVMGIVNASPNSFYKPVPAADAAIKQVAQMVEEGADIIDIGGEATNPFVDLEKEKPEAAEELARILPVLEYTVKAHPEVLVSIDTSSPLVMEACLAAGADMINDQRALILPGALDVVAKYQAPVCLMQWFHPARDPGDGTPEDVMRLTVSNLSARVEACIAAGIQPEQIVLDPGFGQAAFGKNLEENCYLLHHFDQLTALGFPVLAGWSRKSMIGDVLDKPADQRLHGSIAAAVMCLTKGASILRVHDVEPTVDAVKLFMAIEDPSEAAKLAGRYRKWGTAR